MFNVQFVFRTLLQFNRQPAANNKRRAITKIQADRRKQETSNQTVERPSGNITSWFEQTLAHCRVLQ